MEDNVKRACFTALWLLTWHFKHSSNSFTSVCTSVKKCMRYKIIWLQMNKILPIVLKVISSLTCYH